MFNIHEVAQNYDEVEVVNRDALTGFTRRGWVLLVILQESTTHHTKAHETWFDAGNEKRHYYPPDIDCDTLFVVGRKLADKREGRDP